MSFTQQGIWYVCQLEGGLLLYNIPIAFRLCGTLHIPALERSLQEIIHRHESLRTVFRGEDSLPAQVIRPPVPFKIEQIDLTSLPDGPREMEAERLMLEAFRKPFDLANDLLVRAWVIRMAAEEFLFVMSIHHTVADAGALSVLFRELETRYAAHCAGLIPDPPPLPVQYTDFTLWQRQRLEGESAEEILSFWKRQLAGMAPAELSTDHPRPPIQTYPGETVSLEIDPELSAAITQLARQENTTVFTILLATLKLLLYRYTGVDDIVVGSALGARRPEVASLVGLYVNVIVLRTDFSGGPSLRDLLKRVHKMVRESADHLGLPFDRLVDIVKPARDLSRNPLFQVLVEKIPGAYLRFDLAGMRSTWIMTENRTAKFDLSFYVVDTKEKVVGWVEYNTDLFDKATIERLLLHYKTLLRSAVAEPFRPVAKLPMLTDGELHQMVVEWNQTDAEYPAVCVHQLVETQARDHPGDTAVVFEHEHLTYRELNRRANQLAHHLLKLGVGADVPVALCLERGVDMVVGLLGVLKAGGAYIPLDPLYPQARLAFMLDDAKPPVLLTQESLVHVLPQRDGHVFCLDRDKAALAHECTENPGVGQSAESLAYIIYTSGSTGTPKGVQLSHRSFVNLLTSMGRKPGFTRRDRLLAVTSLSFDIAGLEIFLPLINGACVIVASHETTTDGSRLQAELRSTKATVMQATPSTWHLLMQSGWKGDRQLKVLCGGEALPRDLAAALIPRAGSLWNLYGPTETCVWSSVQFVDSVDRPILVGRPIDNTQFYLLDRAGQPVPAGAIGELFIGGAGVARGYLNRLELTAQKFVPDPFSAKAGARMFRTGDLGKFLSGGTLQLLGRIDHQVKIRGFRIELGEVETALAKMPGVRQVVVAAADSGTEKRLVAHVIPSPGAAINNSDVRRFLRDKLPEYMLPAVSVLWDDFPLTGSGKINRLALASREVEFETSQTEFVAPRDSEETLIAQIWEKTLHVKPVGVTQNFFDLGGHSLVAITVLRAVEKALGKKVPLVAVFQAPTVEGFAKIIRDFGWSAPPVIAVQPGGCRPPFFCVYDRFDYGNLAAELGEDQPLYVLPFDRMFDKEMKRGFMDLAREFVSRIRSVQAEGPYYLGGMCLGARVAYAIAHELYRQGDTVALLALIESPAPGYRTAIAAMPFTDRLRFHCIDVAKFEWGILKRLNFRQKIAIIAETMKLDYLFFSGLLKWSLTKKWYRRLGKDVPIGKRNSFQLMREAVGDYCPPESYPGKVTLFRPTERPGNSYRDISMGWKEAPIGNLEIHQIPGRHIEMLRKPNVQILGRVLSDCLRKAQEGPMT